MSRIGRSPIPVADGVEVSISEGNVVTVKGPKGTLTKPMPQDMVIRQEGQEILVSCPEGQENKYKSLWGLTRSLVNNMIVGVTEGYSKTLVMKGVGYRATMQGNKLVLSVGLSHPVEFPEIENIEIETPEVTKIVVRGIDKEQVGAVAADIRSVRLPEPYKGKGIRYEGEHIKLKAGKTGN